MHFSTLRYTFYKLILVVVCPALPTPSNGIVTGTDFTYGRTVVITCYSGYRLSGSSSRTCQVRFNSRTQSQEGYWTGTASTCSGRLS